MATARKARVWQTMSSAPADRPVLFRVPIGTSGFADAMVGQFVPMIGWAPPGSSSVESRIYPVAWCPIPEFDDDDLERTAADKAAMVRPLKKHEHAA